MYKINDYIVYKKDVCIINSIKNTNNIFYYTIFPVDDPSLMITIPSNNKYIRNIISKKEVDTIINEIPLIKIIEADNERMIDLKYKELLSTYSHENLISIIKTTYLRNQSRLNSNKKASEKDIEYFKMAERLLYNEFSIALNKTYEETKEYIIKKVKDLSL